MFRVVNHKRTSTTKGDEGIYNDIPTLMKAKIIAIGEYNNYNKKFTNNAIEVIPSGRLFPIFHLAIKTKKHE